MFLAVLWIYVLVTDDLSPSELGHARASVILADAAEAGDLRSIAPLPALLNYVQAHDGLRYGVAVGGRWLDGSTLTPDFGQASGVSMQDGQFTLATPEGTTGGQTTVTEIDSVPVLILTAGNVPDWLDLAFVGWILVKQIATLLGPILGASLLITWWRLKTELRPLDALAHEATRIDLDRTHQRLDLTAVPVELKPLAQAFNLALERLSTTFTARQRFLDNAAHELRTPLAVMSVRVDTMPPSEERRLLQRDVRRLGALSDQLLASARLSSSWAPAAVPVDLEALLVDLVADYAPLAHDMNLAVGFAMVGKPGRVTGHPVALTAAFANVLDNALRAEPAGGCVEVRLDDERRVSIEDHGAGIDPAVADLVFEPFWRNGEGRQGSGLGLAIVAEIVRHHGATIRVEPTPGGGATFVFSFPAAGGLMPA